MTDLFNIPVVDKLSIKAISAVLSLFKNKSLKQLFQQKQ